MKSEAAVQSLLNFSMYIMKICNMHYRSVSKCVSPIRKKTPAHILFSSGLLEHKFPPCFLSPHPICESHCQGYHSPSQAFTVPRAIMCFTTTSGGSLLTFCASVNVSDVHCRSYAFTPAHCEAATLTQAGGKL